MNGINKTKAADFSCGLCFLRAFPFISLMYSIVIFTNMSCGVQVHVETQKAAYMFERACSMHEAAKEMVQLAEAGYMQRDDNGDPAWQEMLNHATMKVCTPTLVTWRLVLVQVFFLWSSYHHLVNCAFCFQVCGLNYHHLVNCAFCFQVCGLNIIIWSILHFVFKLWSKYHHLVNFAFRFHVNDKELVSKLIKQLLVDHV